MPTKFAPLFPAMYVRALCALTLAAGALACSTSESNSRAGTSAATEQTTSESPAAEPPAPAADAPDAPPADANRYTQLHVAMTIEVDGEVTSTPQVSTMPGKPVTLSQRGGGERPIHLQLQMTPTFVGDAIALAGSLEGKVGEEIAHAQAIDAQVAPGEATSLAFELDGMAYVIEVVVTKSEFQRENSVRQ
ncbi:hypothetical protein EA187_14320 [Lujinxingia sediminis]|uniref:Copper chaperone PCu(A)C n=1 Tax=Lujinxingia sediminis TaxID=2480984 RepID=A0ABY0CRK8_9DELT|nr:hypothetical protein [Lujinxingia sediminis]RVU43006.1 hypothetical protein EA187_14320 [Lujinxingia sediminis]